MGIFMSKRDDVDIISNLSETPPLEILIEDVVSEQRDHHAYDSSIYGQDAPANPVIIDVNNVTDARFIENLGNQNYALSERQDITEDYLKNIETHLDLYEKVSLVFLLFDDVLYALQELELCQDGQHRDLFYKWARHELAAGRDFVPKFIEGLCIIQNYQILSKFGYMKEDIRDDFLPTSYVAKHVDLGRKLIYLVCEKLTSQQRERFIQLVKSDLLGKKYQFRDYESELLEMYFLHWATTATTNALHAETKYISLSNDTNVDNVICIFKQMGLDHICDLLKEVPSKSSVFKNVGKYALSDLPEISERQQHSIISTNGIVQSTEKSTQLMNNVRNRTSLQYGTDTYAPESLNQNIDYSLYSTPSTLSSNDNAAVTEHFPKYYINSEKPGACLIINQFNFYTEIKEMYKHLLPNRNIQLERRDGTQKDKQRLINTFKSFGFKVSFKENIRHMEMLSVINNFLEEISHESSVFICILSHGERGHVYGTNSCKVSVDEIKGALWKTNCKNLSGKPKVLILQSCQGTKCQKAQENSADEVIHENDNVDINDDNDDMTTDGPNMLTKDLLVFSATVPGYGAIRNRKTGSIFIESLCRKMTEIGDREHFGDICTAVTDDVSSQVCKMKKELVSMVPCFDSTFTKKFYLPPLKSQSNENQ